MNEEFWNDLAGLYARMALQGLPQEFGVIPVWNGEIEQTCFFASQLQRRNASVDRKSREKFFRRLSKLYLVPLGTGDFASSEESGLYSWATILEVIPSHKNEQLLRIIWAEILDAQTRRAKL